VVVCFHGTTSRWTLSTYINDWSPVSPVSSSGHLVVDDNMGQMGDVARTFIWDETDRRQCDHSFDVSVPTVCSPCAVAMLDSLISTLSGHRFGTMFVPEGRVKWSAGGGGSDGLRRGRERGGPRTLLVSFDNARLVECLFEDFAHRHGRRLEGELVEANVIGLLDCQVLLRALTRGRLPTPPTPIQEIQGVQSDEAQLSFQENESRPKDTKKFTLDNCLRSFVSTCNTTPITDPLHTLTRECVTPGWLDVRSALICRLFRCATSLPTFTSSHLVLPSSWLHVFPKTQYHFMPIDTDICINADAMTRLTRVKSHLHRSYRNAERVKS
jgi:hypothetical protein